MHESLINLEFLMTTPFSDSNFDTDEYWKNRPTYPAEWFQLLLDYHKGGNDHAMDVGSGPGEVAVRLFGKFKKITAVDDSEVMRQRCIVNMHQKLNQMLADGECPEIGLDEIGFDAILSPSEDITDLKDGSVDMITAGECVHWFDWEKWPLEVSRLLRSQGTVCYFEYTDPVLVDYPEIQQEIDYMIYEDETFLEPYWIQPATSRFRMFLQGLSDHFKNDPDFTDVKVVRYDSIVDKDTSDKLVITRNWTPKQYIDSINTWSASHTWNQTHDVTAGDMVYNRMKELTGWKEEPTLRLVWPSIYVMARRA